MNPPDITNISRNFQIPGTQTEVRVIFSNFVEWSDAASKKPPTLYFTISLRALDSGVGFVLHDLRLTNGQFQNPWHWAGKQKRANGYLNEVTAQLIEYAWHEFVIPELPKWRLMEGAWKGLVFSPEILVKCLGTPYKVLTPEKKRRNVREKAARELGI